MKRMLLLLGVALLLVQPLSVAAADADVRLVTGDQAYLVIGKVVENGDTLVLEPIYYVMSSVNMWEQRETVIPRREGDMVIFKEAGGAYSYLELGDIVLASLDLEEEDLYRVTMGLHRMTDIEFGRMKIEQGDPATNSLIEGFLNRGVLYTRVTWEQLQEFLCAGDRYEEARALLIPAGTTLPARPTAGSQQEDNPFWRWMAIGSGIALAIIWERRRRASK